jgi:hypothetical protein
VPAQRGGWHVIVGGQAGTSSLIRTWASRAGSAAAS